MINMADIKAHFKMCGWTEVQPNKWTLKDINTEIGNLPSTHAQYFNKESEYQYTSIKKLK